MANVTEAIRFCSLLSKLDANEFNAFIVQFIDKCGARILIQSLFNQFIAKEAHANHQYLHTTINIIKRIIESRKRKHKRSIFNAVISIHSLSTELIGEISSYMLQKDHIAFSIINRATYIGCNAPNTLRYLNLRNNNNYAVVNLLKYPHLTHLSIKLNKVRKLRAPINGSSVCNRLQSLEIDGRKQTDLEMDINHLIYESGINIKNVIYLKCKSFGPKNARRDRLFSAASFFRFLSNFQQLKHFYGRNLMIAEEGADILEIKRLFPGLKSLRWDGGSVQFFIIMLKTFGSQLSRLTFYNFDEIEQQIVTNDISFSDLRELCVSNSTKFVIDHIFKTAKDLQIMEVMEHTVSDAVIINTAAVRTMMELLLTKQKALTHLNISYGSYLMHNHVCTGIEQGLLRMEHKNELILGLYFGEKDTQMIDIEDIVLTFSRITNQLQLLNLQNFMFFYSFKGFKGEKHRNLMKQIKDFSTKNEANLKIYRGSSAIMVTNKKCTINGWNAWRQNNMLINDKVWSFPLDIYNS